MTDLSIRPVTADDLEPLYRVCLLTGDAGQDASHMYRDPRLLGEIYVGPYVMLDSGSGFTVADDAGPGGYALAAVDTRRFETECEERWWPPLRERHPDPGTVPATPDEELAAVIHRPPRAPEAVVADYPAHLHLDLLPRFQGRGVGRSLMQLLLSTARESGAEGIHLVVDVRNDRAIGFYRHLGFVPLDTMDDALVMGRQLGG